MGCLKQSFMTNIANFEFVQVVIERPGDVQSFLNFFLLMHVTY